MAKVKISYNELCMLATAVESLRHYLQEQVATRGIQKDLEIAQSLEGKLDNLVAECCATTSKVSKELEITHE